MTESGDINTIASRDIEDAVSGFKGKFIPIDNNNILIGHVGICTPFEGNFEEDIFYLKPPALSMRFLASAGQRQSQLQLIQKEALSFSGYDIKNPNPNTQIPNNIQIRKTNFRNISISLLIFYVKTDCFEF